MLHVVPSKDATLQHVTVHLTSPPIVGVSVMKPSDPGPLLLRFDIQTSDLERFLKTVQARNLVGLRTMLICFSIFDAFDVEKKRETRDR